MSDLYVRRVDKFSTVYDVDLLVVRPDNDPPILMRITAEQADTSDLGVTIHSRRVGPGNAKDLEENPDNWSFWPWSQVLRIHPHIEDPALAVVKNELIIPNGPKAV